MANLAMAAGRAPSGVAIAAFNRAVFAMYGTSCHLCGGPGANTADHLIPLSERPDLRWDIDNARPAHRSCNSMRKDAPLPSTWDAGW